MSRDDGFATTEFVLGFCVLVLPMVLLVTLLPTWSEARQAATSAADAAARSAAIAVATDQSAWNAGARAARTVLAAHGVDGTVEVDATPTHVTVSVRVPLRALPALVGTSAGPFATTATAVQLVDVYRAPGDDP